MARAITKFAANDGTEFNTEAEALAHDAREAVKAKVEEYVAAAKVHKTHAGYLRRVLPDYMAWIETGVTTLGAEPAEQPAETAEA
jgi:hypothetical protein